MTLKPSLRIRDIIRRSNISLHLGPEQNPRLEFPSVQKKEKLSSP